MSTDDRPRYFHYHTDPQPTRRERSREFSLDVLAGVVFVAVLLLVAWVTWSLAMFVGGN